METRELVAAQITPLFTKKAENRFTHIETDRQCTNEHKRTNLGLDALLKPNR